MASKRPSFVDSEFFVDEPGNWHLKPGAPRHVQMELQDFLEGDEAGDLKDPPRLTAKDLVE